METNVEEGISGIGTLLGLIVALFVISAVIAAYYSGYLDGFFKGLKAVLGCLTAAKGNPQGIVDCLKLFARWLGINI